MTKNQSHDADVAFIRALAELLRENDLTELEVQREHGEDDSLNVRVCRERAPSGPPPPAVPAQHLPAPAAPATPVPPEPMPADADDPANHPGAVTSPMVGTVYLRPEPEAESFVKVGESVTEGQTLMIVEAMKTMNHIPSPRAGIVRRILVEDGSPVEYGAPLLIVD